MKKVDEIQIEEAQPYELFNGLSYSGKMSKSRTPRKAAHLKAVAKRRAARKRKRGNK